MELFAFPFAGGGENCYKDLQNHLRFAPLNTQSLPGRGKLFGQSCITDAESLVDYQYAQLAAQLHQPYGFFGHSMGAFLAFMLSRKIVHLSKTHPNILKPSFLILSGRRAPSVAEKNIKHLLPQDAFRQMLCDLGGIPDMVLQDPDIMDLFEPVIRADFKLLETYQYEADEVLDIPTFLFLGKDDNVTPEEAAPWQDEIVNPIDIEYFEGGHFYFNQFNQPICRRIDSIFLKYSS